MKSGYIAFSSPEMLQRRIDEYFESLRVFVREIETAKDGTQIERVVEVPCRPPTVAGLALALDVSHTTLRNYELRQGPQWDPAFGPIITRAKTRIAEWVETALYDKNSSRGAQFALTVNHGYGSEAAAMQVPGGFTQNVIAPITADPQAKAIPKWKATDE